MSVDQVSMGGLSGDGVCTGECGIGEHEMGEWETVSVYR